MFMVSRSSVVVKVVVIEAIVYRIGSWRALVYILGSHIFIALVHGPIIGRIVFTNVPTRTFISIILNLIVTGSCVLFHFI